MNNTFDKPCVKIYHKDFLLKITMEVKLLKAPHIKSIIKTHGF